MWHYQHFSLCLTKCQKNLAFLVLFPTDFPAFYLMVGSGEEQEYRYVLYDEDKAEYTDYQVK